MQTEEWMFKSSQEGMRPVISVLLNNGVQELSKNEGFQQTRREPKELVEAYKKRFAVFPALWYKISTF